MGENSNKFADVPIRIKGWGYIIAVFSLGIINEITMAVFVVWLIFQVWREVKNLHKFQQKWWLFFGIGFSFSFLFFIRIEENGLKLLLFLVILTELNDVFQYLSGKIFGKTNILPKISPNKTLEGVLGGIIMSIFLSLLLGKYLLLMENTLFLIILGGILAVLGFCGDVLMSFVKRKSEVKDTGNLIAGHGGLLDRMDSLIFNAPLFYGLIYWEIL